MEIHWAVRLTALKDDKNTALFRDFGYKIAGQHYVVVIKQYNRTGVAELIAVGDQYGSQMKSIGSDNADYRVWSSDGQKAVYKQNDELTTTINLRGEEMYMKMNKTLLLAAVSSMIFVLPYSAFSADKLVVKDIESNQVFKVSDTGDTFTKKSLGIGTQTPTEKIHILNSGDAGLRIEASGAAGVDADGFLKFVRGSNTEYATLSFQTGETSDWNIQMLPGVGDLRIAELPRNYSILYLQKSTGNIGMGVVPTRKLELKGGAYSDGSAWYDASSRELKDNIVNLSTDDAVTALKGLNPVTYVYKRNPEDNRVGFIAEDVPEIVATETRKSLSSMDITAVLTKVVQEQQEIIEELKAEISGIKFDLQTKQDMVKVATLPDM